MTDLQATLAAMRETLTRADADGHCRCYHESQERECHQHGDEHARLDGDMADALRKALNAVEAVWELIEEHARREAHNETVPLNRICDLLPEPTSQEYRRALDGVL